MSTKYREEKDTMGVVRVPKDAYYGAQTQRAAENFRISGLTFPPSFIKALSMIKKHAARVNLDLGLLDGELAEDVLSFFLPEYCSDPLPSMDIFKSGSRTTIALSKDGPPPEAPFDLTFATVIPDAMERYRSRECRHEWRIYLLHCPCKTLVQDVFIRDDLYVGTVPEICLYIASPGGPVTVRHPGDFGTMNTLDMTMPIEQLGMGLTNIEVKETPTYSRLLRHAFDRVGWDPSRYRGYRIRTTYPVPMIYMNWWFELPEPPK